MRINIPDTNTTGKHSYVVARACGGVMEDHEIHYEDHQIIHADTEAEAQTKYEKLNGCTYYYGCVLRCIK